MTISDQSAHLPKQYTGDGVTAAFATGFTFYDETEVLVVERLLSTGVETTLANGTHYTITGGSGSTGTVTAITAYIPSNLKTWTLSRISPQTQTADYVAGDAFSAGTHETTLDKLALQIQDLNERVDRCLKYPRSDSPFITASLPPSVVRASQSLWFNLNGAPTVVAGTVSTAGVSGFMLTLLDDASQNAAQTTLGLVPGTNVQAQDAQLADLAGLTPTDNQVIRGNGTNFIMEVQPAGDVSYSNGGTNYIATNVQTALDERHATLTLFQLAADQTASTVSSEVAITTLNNMTIPGTPNGVRKYRAVGQINGIAGAPDVTARVRAYVGTNGNITTDTLTWEGWGNGIVSGERFSIPFNFQFTPAASTKLSFGYIDTTGNNSDIAGDATVLETYCIIGLY